MRSCSELPCSSCSLPCWRRSDQHTALAWLIGEWVWADAAILFVAHMCHTADLLCTCRPQHDWRHQPAGLAARHHPVRHQGWCLTRHIAHARQRKRHVKSCTHVPCSCRVRPRIACLQRGLRHRRWAEYHPRLRLGGVCDAGGAHSASCRCRVPSHAVKLGAWLGRDSCHCKHVVCMVRCTAGPFRSSQIALWFRADELANYKPVATAWIYE